MALISVNPFWTEVKKDVLLLGLGATIGIATTSYFFIQSYMPKAKSAIVSEIESDFHSRAFRFYEKHRPELSEKLRLSYLEILLEDKQ